MYPTPLPKFATSSADACPVRAVGPEGLEALPEAAAAWAQASGFKAGAGEVCLVPGAGGGLGAVLLGLGSEASRGRRRFATGDLPARLPEGSYVLEGDWEPREAEEAALGWLFGSYRFTRYVEGPAPAARLVCPEGLDAARLEAIAAGEFLTRDLINTPTSDMGPEALEAAFLALADEHGAEARVVRGEALLEQNFPMIHAVGRASAEAPRLLDMRWGEAGPTLTLVGKGVCFDTGGLNLKPGASMGLMKKDMGGSATVMGLARMIMALGLRVKLRVLVPAVENSVSSNSFRPQDILTSRKGLTVEINNTDAEGRLVLADALTYAGEESPDMIVSFATLTGAARVAVGDDISPFFTGNEALAGALDAAGAEVADPVWRLPFHAPYEPRIEPGIADLDNAPKGGMAGAITAALFLRRFVPEGADYTHFDVYGWQPSPAPGRPKGGVGMGARALLAALPKVLA
ncbi:M17 family metallopeptidase [Oceanicola sp. 502str15]|uniref:leucyl aminopeptidase family protein n=1 Tax=Oceanicola sp. 502str15 TaxID=2696061 RepID=UPI0020961A6F|nr:leucyl aminopeptidase family protein [Oceanicola sp. 502str15]MCO6383639.1 leucyl aminopeptidase family protein [Oceanicola sp. 502str15]